MLYKISIVHLKKRLLILTKNDICNLNEVDDIIYLDDNESTSDSENTNQIGYSHNNLLLFVEPEDLSSLEDCYVKDTVYTQKTIQDFLIFLYIQILHIKMLHF